MKLYFYILKCAYNKPSRLTYSECEVIERPKTYKPFNEFPKGFYGSYVRKEDIGHLIGYGHDILALEEKDDKRAKEIFTSHFNKVIDSKKHELERIEEQLKAVNEFEED